ncbi:MAG: phage-shock protein [Verrucomicrobiota bacterium]|nr:phage-shock protein [Verrucomicrobiota bacterium]
MLEEFIPLIIVFIVIGIPVICFTLIKIAKIMKGGNAPEPTTSGRSGAVAEETRMLQEMNQTLGRLETRIEALETIVLERERKKGAL